MKRNLLTIVVGALLLIIFVLLLFTFQVRQVEVAVVTTFGNPTRYIDEPGFRWKWPLPIQRVYKFDKRVQTFEDRFEETLTQDGINLLATVYVGWTIDNPQQFFNSFPSGEPEEAQPKLEALVRSAKNEVIGKHPFGHFISTDPAQLQLQEIEQQILGAITPLTQNYGVSVKFLGFKRLGLPESVTQKVFDRMKAERQREVQRLQAEGEAEALSIRSAADSARDKILAEAEAKANVLRGQAAAASSEAFAVFDENPELAIFLMKIRAVEDSLKEKATLLLNDRVAPFDVLTRQWNEKTLPEVDAQPSPPRGAPSTSSNSPRGESEARPAVAEPPAKETAGSGGAEAGEDETAQTVEN